MADPFGDSGGSTSNSSTNNTSTTVNTTVDIGVDTKPIAEALTGMAASQAQSNLDVATINATAMTSIAKTLGTATSTAQKQLSDTLAAYQQHVDADTKANLLLGLATAAALFFAHK